jgi:hypothetical protein
VAERDPLHGEDALRRRAQDGIDDFVGQEIGLVDIEQVAIGARQQTPAQAPAAGLPRPLVETADDVFEARVERQLHQPHAVEVGQRFPLAVLPRAVGADGVDAAALDVLRQAAGSAKAARHLRQQVPQAADGGRLTGAARSEQQHAADVRIDQGQEQSQLHFLLADEGQEGKDQLLR